MGRGGWVYIMTNRYNRVFYTGVPADLPARIWQHRNGNGSRFCNRYNLTKLVYVEEHPTIEEAIVREKRIKEWKRAWKVEVIEKANPDWRDLFDDIL